MTGTAGSQPFCTTHQTSSTHGGTSAAECHWAVSHLPAAMTAVPARAREAAHEATSDIRVALSHSPYELIDMALDAAAPLIAAAATAELKANLQAAIERVEHAAAAAQEKAAGMAVAAERERCAQLAEQVDARYADLKAAAGTVQPISFLSFAGLLRHDDSQGTGVHAEQVSARIARTGR